MIGKIHLANIAKNRVLLLMGTTKFADPTTAVAMVTHCSAVSKCFHD